MEATKKIYNLQSLNVLKNTGTLKILLICFI